MDFMFASLPSWIAEYELLDFAKLQLKGNERANAM